jgi:hypothetical protein
VLAGNRLAASQRTRITAREGIGSGRLSGTTSISTGNPKPELMDGFTKIERSACNLEVLVDYAGNEPVVLAPVDFVLGKRQVIHRSCLQVDFQKPARIIERLDRHAVLVFPLSIALGGVPPLKPGQGVRPVGVKL